MLQVNSSDPMALRPKKRNEMTTDEPARAGYQTPNPGAQFVFPLQFATETGSTAIPVVPVSLDPQASSDRSNLLLALVVETGRGEQETLDPVLTAGFGHIAQNVIAVTYTFFVPHIRFL